MALFGTISDGEIKQKPVINKYTTAKWANLTWHTGELLAQVYTECWCSLE